MATYDSTNLKSTLCYIKDRFGIEVFQNQGKVFALLSDLAPSLKNDRSMIEKLSRLGILEDLINHRQDALSVQKQIVAKAMMKLTEEEFIRSDIANLYINTMLEVFGWSVSVDIPEDTAEDATDPKKKFERYKKGAEAGEAYAMNNLGYCYQNGLGVGSDDKQAEFWYRKAAEAGNKDAERHLKEMNR